MVLIEKVLISEAIFDEYFCCDLPRCKGACCVAGDAGAPVTDEECDFLDKNFEKIAPYMQPEGIKAVIEQGKYVIDVENEKSTPLIEGRECAYTIFDNHGIASCAIEKAREAGKINFRKPISCYLYPIRLRKHPNVSMAEYDEWHICQSAREKGKEEGIRVFEFLKPAIIEKFGEEFYKAMVYYQSNSK